LYFYGVFQESIYHDFMLSNTKKKMVINYYKNKKS